MSINLKNPKTLLELIDAARNHNAQIRIAAMVGDMKRVEKCVDESESLLLTAQARYCELSHPA